MTKLSVIIIGRNEASHIKRCLLSVLKGIQTVPDTEVIYSDSASTDNTIDIVRQYPVHIYQLKPDWPLSAAAGRYTAYRHASGKYLFFIDGDTLLYRNWLPRGIRFLEEHQEAAVVAGSVHEIFEDEAGKTVGFLKHRYGHLAGPASVKAMGGIALYRKSVLDQVGPFNPFIAADEEPELGIRIRHAGYRLFRLPEPMAITYGLPRQTVGELFRRYQSRLYTFGTTLRYCQKNGYGLQYIRERLGHLVSYVLVMTGFTAVAVFLIRQGWFLYGIGSGCLAVLLLRVTRPSLYRRLWISFIKRTLMTVRTVQTYILTKPEPFIKYPEDALYIAPEAQ